MLATLKTVAENLGASRPEIAEIRLFGSLARGTRNPFADADLLIVLDASDVPVLDRPPLYKPLGIPIPIDLTVCTRGELDRELAAGNRFVRQIVAESVPLYTRETGTKKEQRR